jgi:SSS family solute:Na+ symporter
MIDQLDVFDFFVVVFFLGLYLILPKLTAKNFAKDDYDQEYILMSRGLTLPLFVATLTSTWYGGILGVTQIAFLQGIYSFFTQGLFWYAAYFIFAIVLVKKIRQKKVLSLPELIGQKFGTQARTFSAIILFFHALPVTYSISVGVLLQLMLGIDFIWALILGVSIVALYTSMGGFRSVVLTDCLQFALMFFAVIMVVVVCITKFGGVSFLASSLPPHYFVWQGENPISKAIVWLFIACTSTFTHPVFYQRCFAAKSDSVAIGGILISMFFWFLFDMCTTLGGMYARVLLPKADSATAYLGLGMSILPHGLRGLFLSGVLATILSTLDSFLFVSGTSMSYDVAGNNKRFRGYNHQIAIVFSGLLVIFISALFEKNFEATWLFMGGAFSTSMMVPVLAGVIFKKRFSNINFFIPAMGALFSFSISTVLYKKHLLTIQPFYVAHGVAFLLFVMVLQIKTKRHTEIANLADG